MSEGRTRPTAQSIKEAYDRLFSSGLSLSKIKDAALENRLFPSVHTSGIAGRSLAWKLFLLPHEPLLTPTESTLSPDLAFLRVHRKKFSNLLLEKMRAPDGSYEDGFVVPGTNIVPMKESAPYDLDTNNPLSLHNENPWTEWFASVDLRKTILQDVERTFPEVGYFRESSVQLQLTNILFLYSVANPSVGYRQGMHELLAPLYHAVDFDTVSQDAGISNPTLLELCSRSWVAADAWALFEAVMRGVSRWYEWRESPVIPKANASPLSTHVHFNVSDGQNELKSYKAPIVKTCNRLQSTLLRSVDPFLFRNMLAEPQIYGIRWLRLLFTREFSMEDAMILWDGLFACDPTFELAPWVCVAMLIRIRNQLIPSDYSGQLAYLLRYPSPPRPPEADFGRPPHHASLLVRQALALQMAPTPSTGTSVIIENHNFLNTAIDIPDPPSVPTRRRVGHTIGDKSASISAQRPGVADSNNNPQGHTRQLSPQQPGLPEMITRSLLDRGESLGINKTLMNAVSELRRNMPDIASSLGRSSATSSTSYTAFPLTDERSSEERPPWEPRTRVEMEREIASLRATNKKLGKSVGWIVDVLLQDASEAKAPQDIESIQIRKREALESLSYVRDVLLGNTNEVDDTRLVGEEELKTRRSREGPTKRQEPPRATVPRPASVPVAESRPRPMSSPALPYVSDAVRSQHPHVPTFPPRRPSSPSPSFASTQTLSDFNSTRLAPWKHTRSNFSGVNLPAATLPRFPPPVSAILHKQVAISSEAVPSTGRNSGDGVPTEIQHDPLGVL